MGTVTKALSLLNNFSLSRPEIGLSEMTRLSDLNKATVYRLLRELQDQGFVEQAGAGRAYRLGAGVLRLAALREASVPLLNVSREILRTLSDRTGETAHMSVLRGQKLSALAYTYSRAHATKVTMEDTGDLAFHATGSGLAVLAFSDPEFVSAVLSRPLPAYTSNTITDRKRILAQLETIRRVGTAESVAGFEDEVHSHAAPVFGTDRRPVGALAVAAPCARITPQAAAEIRRELAIAARQLTERIGGFFPEDFPLERAA